MTDRLITYMHENGLCETVDDSAANRLKFQRWVMRNTSMIQDGVSLSGWCLIAKKPHDGQPLIAARPGRGCEADDFEVGHYVEETNAVCLNCGEHIDFYQFATWRPLIDITAGIPEDMRK